MYTRECMFAIEELEQVMNATTEVSELREDTELGETAVWIERLPPRPLSPTSTDNGLRASHRISDVQQSGDVDMAS